MTIINGNLIVTKQNQHQFRDVTKVGGYINIHEGEQLSAPVLTEVGGYIDLHEGAQLTAPVLTGVKGYIYLCEGAQLSASKLTNVEGEQLTKPPVVFYSNPWSVCITESYLRIGCQRHTHERWTVFSDELISRMGSQALEFLRANRSKLLDLCTKQAV